VNWVHRKRPQFAGSFVKRLKGFEPSTFCMASRTCVPLGVDIPCKHGGSRVWASFCDSPAFTAKSRGFGYPVGNRRMARVLSAARREVDTGQAARGAGSALGRERLLDSEGLLK
jgi:hypothetical protein